MSNERNSFAVLLKKRRKDLNISQKEAASRSKISEAAIAMFETGRRNPKPDVILKLMDGLGMSVEDVMPFVPDTMQDLLEREVGRQLLDTGPDLSDLNEVERKRMEEAFLASFSRIPLLEGIRPDFIEPSGHLTKKARENGELRHIYGLGGGWPGAFLLDMDMRDLDSPLPGCYRVLIAPELEAAPGGYAVIVRPHSYALRRVFTSAEYLIIESAHNREVILWETFTEWIEEGKAAILAVVETWSRHEQPPRPALFR